MQSTYSCSSRAVLAVLLSAVWSCNSGNDKVADRQCAGNGDCQSSSAGVGGSIRDSGLNFGDSGIMLPDAANQDFEAGGPSVCARSDVIAGRVTPTVILIIDQSSSMNDPLGGGSRWNVLRDFLLKDDGLIKSLQDKMRFGVAMYSARSDLLDGKPQECPMVTSVNAALNNYDAIAAAYRKAEPIDETPTGDSITKILNDLPKPGPDAPMGPVIFVLATDGEPDRCEELNPQNGQAETLAAVKAAFDMNIQTFVIGVGAEISMKHQQDVANAGVGHKPGDPNAPFWTAGDDQSLRNALMAIIGAQISCDIALKGRVEGDACSGKVTLSGNPLACKNADGWELVDPSHVRLVGKACTEFKKQEVSTLDITFPCASVILD